MDQVATLGAHLFSQTAKISGSQKDKGAGEGIREWISANLSLKVFVDDIDQVKWD